MKKNGKKQQEQDLLEEGSWSESQRLAGLDERKEPCLSDKAMHGELKTKRRDIAHRTQGDDKHKLSEELETDESKLCVSISNIPKRLVNLLMSLFWRFQNFWRLVSDTMIMTKATEMTKTT